VNARETATRLRQVTLPDGLALECAERGEPGGTPVLFLHGITDSWRSFEPVLPWLPGHWHTVAVSQRGHGGSARPESGYGTRDFAADAAALIEALGLASVVVVGHSMGAAVALRLAIDRPELVRGVAAAGAFASFGDKAELVEFIGSMLTLGDTVPRQVAESFQRDTIAGPAEDGLIETMVDECLRTPAAVWRGAFAGLLEDDFSAELGRVRVPVLLPWGDADAFAPEGDQQRLARELPLAMRSVYPGVGHALHWERPERFALDLARFVGGLATGMPETSPASVTCARSSPARSPNTTPASRLPSGARSRRSPSSTGSPSPSS
jgi:non-heme chloroperoxidase